LSHQQSVFLQDRRPARITPPAVEPKLTSAMSVAVLQLVKLLKLLKPNWAPPGKW